MPKFLLFLSCLASSSAAYNLSCPHHFICFHSFLPLSCSLCSIQCFSSSIVSRHAFLYLAFSEYYCHFHKCFAEDDTRSFETLRFTGSEVRYILLLKCFLLAPKLCNPESQHKKKYFSSTVERMGKTSGQVPICYKQVKVMMTHCAKHLFCKHFHFQSQGNQGSLLTPGGQCHHHQWVCFLLIHTCLRQNLATF